METEKNQSVLQCTWISQSQNIIFLFLSKHLYSNSNSLFLTDSRKTESSHSHSQSASSNLALSKLLLVKFRNIQDLPVIPLLLSHAVALSQCLSRGSQGTVLWIQLPYPDLSVSSNGTVAHLRALELKHNLGQDVLPCQTPGPCDC